MKIDNLKSNQRKIFLKLRSKIKKKNLNAESKIVENLKNFNYLDKFEIVASFISINSEISMIKLNDFLLSNGKKLCLPVIKNDSLIFRQYEIGNDLKKGKFNIPEPHENKPELVPDLIFTPCLAFDEKGYRLGYGGGFYDKTFKKFNKENHNFNSIIVAFEDQKVDNVIIDANDMKVDYMLTEKKVYKSK
ncbi:MAG: 5-formyltetrahydrofolate cyclo-ligase [Alphaproteobacteria bacterium MarineAlpha5_Bin9]|nr:MAG: 5-formyltetrahydrofolate cyclo-ligase [Alphaproteobacteria bacterium MarineAlpha5_Bin9]|tara:strand:+ start:15332 stop:15901 length:570 start_codon:yes stop_codon:yes gene_type:complete